MGRVGLHIPERSRSWAFGGQDFGPQNGLLKEYWGLIWLPKQGLEAGFRASIGSKLRSGSDVGARDRLIIGFPKTDHLFLDPFGGLKEAKIIQKSV